MTSPIAHRPSHIALILGCGYLGHRVAERLLARGDTVYGTARDDFRLNDLADAGLRAARLNVIDADTFGGIEPALRAESLDVYYLVPPGRSSDAFPSPRQVVIDGLTNVLGAFGKHNANVRRMVLASSTGVYGQSGGERVDADTPPQPSDHRGELLLAGERLWLDAGPHAHVVRLAGLYGPGRVINQRAVCDGAPIVGRADALLNLIHVDDAADLMIAVMDADSPAPGRIELGCDGHPVPRIEYYRELARRLDAPAPQAVSDDDAIAKYGLSPDRIRRTSNKACDNTITCQRTGWRPRYADFRAGLDAVLERGRVAP